MVHSWVRLEESGDAEVVGLAEVWPEAADTKTVSQMGRESESAGVSGPWVGRDLGAMAEVGCMAVHNIEKERVVGAGRDVHKGRSLPLQDWHALEGPNKGTKS